MEQLEPRQGGIHSLRRDWLEQNRADGEPEHGLRQQWCRVSGGRVIMVVFPAAAESPRERGYTWPHTRGEWELAALGRLMAYLGALIAR